jgi:hypothetical protein
MCSFHPRREKHAPLTHPEAEGSGLAVQIVRATQGQEIARYVSPGWMSKDKAALQEMPIVRGIEDMADGHRMVHAPGSNRRHQHRLSATRSIAADRAPSPVHDLSEVMHGRRVLT